MTKDKERDDALIAIDEAFDMLGGISDASEARDKLLVAMRALRGDEPAKPDRYELDAYDAGLMPDYGSKTDWWWAYIRAELGRAHDFYQAQIDEPAVPIPDPAQKPIDVSFTGRCSPTHRCKVCGALWIEYSNSWSLCSKECGSCCDSAPMLNQIEPLLQSDLVTWEKPAKPDRWTLATREVLVAYVDGGAIYTAGVTNGEHDNLPKFQAAAAVLRRNFEPPSDVVAAAKKVRGVVPGSYGVVPGSNIAIMRDFILKGDQ